MKKILLSLLIFCFLNNLIFGQTLNLFKNKDVWGNSKPDLQNIVDGTNKTSSDIYSGEYFIIDTEIESVDTSTIQMLSTPEGGTETFSYGLWCEIETSNDNINYEFLIKTQDLVRNKDQWNYPKSRFINIIHKRFLKFKFLRGDVDPWRYCDHMRIFEIVANKVFDGSKFNIIQEGNYYKKGDSVKLKVEIPKEYKDINYNFIWNPNLGNFSEIYVNNPGKYEVRVEILNYLTLGKNSKYYMRNGLCDEKPFDKQIDEILNFNLIVSKEITEVNELSNDEIIYKKYYDLYGREINNIDEYRGLYLEKETNHTYKLWK